MKWTAVALALGIAAAGEVAAGSPTAAAPGGAIDGMPRADTFEADQLNELQRAREHLDRGAAIEALPIIDAVIARYASRFPEDGIQRFDVRSTGEALATSALAVSRNARSESLQTQWSDAWYMRAYALVELRRGDEARQALQSALHLAPMNSQYHAELGNLEQDARNWDAAYASYSDAAAYAGFSPSGERAHDLARARRGQGFVRVEQGRLDEADALYREAARLDPADVHAPHELAYIAELRREAK